MAYILDHNSYDTTSPQVGVGDYEASPGFILHCPVTYGLFHIGIVVCERTVHWPLMQAERVAQI